MPRARPATASRPATTSSQVAAVVEETGLSDDAARRLVRGTDLLMDLAAKHESRCKGCNTCRKWRHRA